MSGKSSEEYKDKDIVWVKLGRGLWWPGEVCGESSLPDDFFSSLKTKPIAIVRFFNEDQYEYVKSYANICKYNNPKKNDFIRKGLDSYRANHKHVEKFPVDIGLAERLTNGDPNIISREEFQPPSKKSCWADIFNDKKTTKNSTANKKTKLPPSAGLMARSPVIRKSIDHEVRILTQPSHAQTNSYSVNSPSVSEQIYRCHLCDFSSKRVNVVMLHSKTHSNSSAPSTPVVRQPIVPKPHIPTPTIPILNKSIQNIISPEREDDHIILSDSSDDDDAVCITRKDIVVPKKRGRPFRKDSPTPVREYKRGKRKIVDVEPEIQIEPKAEEENPISKIDLFTLPIEDEDCTVTNLNVTISTPKKPRTENKVELKKKLLEDWVEDDSDSEIKTTDISDAAADSDNLSNVVADENSVLKEKPENNINELDKKDDSSSSIKYIRNIPKKDRKRDFVFDELNSSIGSNKSNLSTDMDNSGTTQKENDVVIDLLSEGNNVEEIMVAENVTTPEKETPIEETIDYEEAIIKTTIDTPQPLDIITIESDNVQVIESIADDVDAQIDGSLTETVATIVENKEDEDEKDKNDDQMDLAKQQIPKPSEITCFDFQDDDEMELAKSPPRRPRQRKSFNLDNHNKLSSDAERENDIQMQTDMLLKITDLPQLPDIPVPLSSARLSTSNDNVDVKEKKEYSLPPKERGKRIFKSRNRNKVSTLIQGGDEIIKKLGIELHREVDEEKKDVDDNVTTSPLKPSESDLQIAETLINMPARTPQIIHSNLDENTVVACSLSGSANENNPIPVSRKKHLQAAFRAEEEKINQIKSEPSHKKATIVEKKLSSGGHHGKQSPQLISISPQQKIVTKLKDEMILTNNSSKFEPRTPKKRKPTIDDDNVFDINNMEIVISNDVIQNESNENIQTPIEPIVIQAIGDDYTLLDSSTEEIKVHGTIKKPKLTKSTEHSTVKSSKLESKSKLSVGSDTNKKHKLMIKTNEMESTAVTNSTVSYKKSQIIQATAGGQIVITSKGQLLTTNTQSQLKTCLQTCETTTSCAKSISSIKCIESAPKIQVQSQKIIYPQTKSKLSKIKSNDKNSSDSPNKVKMSMHSISEMTKLGLIKEKGTERIITPTGLKRFKQHLMTESKQRIPQLVQSTSSDSSLSVATTSGSQIAQQCKPAAMPSPKLHTETIVTTETFESPPPQIIATTPAAPLPPAAAVAASSSEITENYYACAAESFGGPPNSFFLCRAGDNNTFIPIDNRALYLDANNRLVEEIPDIINTFDSIANPNNVATSTVSSCDQITTLELNSSNNSDGGIQMQDVPQSFIINTVDGQQIILDQQSYLSLAAGEMPHLITADGQQIILQGSPQDIITAITVNQQEISQLTDEQQHIIIPQNDEQSKSANSDILSVALEGFEVYQRPDTILGDVIIQNNPPPHSDIVASHTVPTAAILSKPIMSTLEVPTKTKTLDTTATLTLDTGLNIDDSLAAIGVSTTHSNVPSSLELPITVTNPAIASKTSPLSLNTIYTPTISSISALGQISQVSPSLGYDLFDTSSSSSSSKSQNTIMVRTENHGNILSPNIAISSQVNNSNNNVKETVAATTTSAAINECSRDETENLNLNNYTADTDHIVEDEMENGSILPQSPEVEIHISSVVDDDEDDVERDDGDLAGNNNFPLENYDDDNSDNSDEIPIQPNSIGFNNDNSNNIANNNGHDIIEIYDNNSKKLTMDDTQSSPNNNNSNINKDDRR